MAMYKSKNMINDSKLAGDKRIHSVKCVCSHRVSTYYVNKNGWTVCDHCGRRIYRPKDEFKMRLMSALEGEKHDKENN